jgi:hypothetical protein
MDDINEQDLTLAVATGAGLPPPVKATPPRSVVSMPGLVDRLRLLTPGMMQAIQIPATLSASQVQALRSRILVSAKRVFPAGTVPITRRNTANSTLEVYCMTEADAEPYRRGPMPKETTS